MLLPFVEHRVDFLPLESRAYGSFFLSDEYKNQEHGFAGRGKGQGLQNFRRSVNEL